MNVDAILRAYTDGSYCVIGCGTVFHMEQSAHAFTPMPIEGPACYNDNVNINNHNYNAVASTAVNVCKLTGTETQSCLLYTSPSPRDS